MRYFTEFHNGLVYFVIEEGIRLKFRNHSLKKILHFSSHGKWALLTSLWLDSYFEFYSYSIKNRKTHKAFLLEEFPSLVFVLQFLKIIWKYWRGQLNTGPPFSTGHMFQDPQWMPTAVDSTKPYI